MICSLYVSYCLYYSIRPQINQVIAGNALQICWFVVPPVMQQFWAYLSVKQHLSHKVLLSQHFCPNLTIEIIVDLWYYVITERETTNQCNQ